MKNSDFLIKLKKDGKLKIVDLSIEISKSYEKKSQECREVAKLAFDNGYFESTVTQSYYSMYNNLLSLFFKCGIKCGNHSASMIILRDFFKQIELYNLFSKAKEERIDKQYYTPESQQTPLTKDSVSQSFKIANLFNIRLNILKNNLSNNEISEIRENLKKELKY